MTSGTSKCHQQLDAMAAPTSAIEIPRYIGFRVIENSPDMCKGDFPPPSGPPIIGVPVFLNKFLGLIAKIVDAMNTAMPRANGISGDDVKMKIGAAFGHKNSFPAAMVTRNALYMTGGLMDGPPPQELSEQLFFMLLFESEVVVLGRPPPRAEGVLISLDQKRAEQIDLDHKSGNREEERASHSCLRP